jgi:pimeloyl-ACP methyl ester carboxylesterase
VVLLHGLASSFDHNWREPGWVDLLTEAGRDVLAINLPGHGPGPHATVPDAYPDVPAEVTRRLDAAAPAALAFDAVGFSLGGRTLLAVAAAQPQRFRRLAILGVGDDAVGPAAGVGAGGVGSASFIPHSAELAAVFASGEEPAAGPGRLFWRLAQAAGNDPAVLAAFLSRAVGAVDPAGLARIECPVLVVIGERDRAADGLVAALPHARLVVLRGVDHFATTSDYRCVQAVLSFLDQ